MRFLSVQEFHNDLVKQIRSLFNFIHKRNLGKNILKIKKTLILSSHCKFIYFLSKMIFVVEFIVP